MKLPDILETEIIEKLQNTNLKDLKFKASDLSTKYMNDERKGQTLLSTYQDAIVYSVMRMPATYAAVRKILEQIESNLYEINSYMDVGAGTGAATWAVNDMLNVKKVTCIEREDAMQRLGKELMQKQEDLRETKWINLDVVKQDLPVKADLIIASYMINEIREEERLQVVEKLFNNTNKILIIIEPGTPAGFGNIRRIQKYAIDGNIKILAPCIGQTICQLPEDDWCHTTVRISRNKYHKYLKSGTAPYEDEKFSYIVLTKTSNIGNENMTKNIESRILRHPIIEKGKVTMKLCDNGEITERTITKGEKDLFKEAKKKDCGDMLILRS